ncbi:4-azaleucine resistance transporter AzlC [Amorphus suaedae]
MSADKRASERASQWSDGALAILPVAAAASPFGLLLGAMAAQKGLSPLETSFMSASVFAGSSQFVAVDLWNLPLAVATIVFATFLVNTRHILMGVSLLPKMGAFTPRAKPLALFFLADEIWALAERRAAIRELTPGYYFGMAVTLYGCWLSFTLVGTFVGGALGDPARLGLDFAFTALFIGLLMGFRHAPRFALTVAVSAVVSALVALVSTGPNAIAAGALAGIVAAAMAPRAAEAVA